MPQQLSDNLLKLAFLFGVIFFSVLYGMTAMFFRIFPYQQVVNAHFAWEDLTNKDDWLYQRTDQTRSLLKLIPEAIQPGLSKIVRVAENGRLGIEVITSQGERVHHWDIDWFALWGDATHLPPEDKPKKRPGTHIHGAAITADGGVVFNFEHLGLVKLNACGEVSWRLPYRTHHSIYIDQEKNIWVSGQINRTKPLDYVPNYQPPFIEPMVLKISPDGKILEEKSVFRLLLDNNRAGLLYLTGRDNFSTEVKSQIPLQRLEGDTLHLNDVEIYEGPPAFFKPGDRMISLRNVNTILVFDPQWCLKYQWSNEFIRQHDPDFIDGVTLAVFDNNNVADDPTPGYYSRILKHTVDPSNAGMGKTEIVWSGSATQPFYSSIMGKQQWLANGNLLLTESRHGRALEVDAHGNPVWEYLNLLKPGWLGVMEEAARLPVTMDASFFTQATAACRK
jgi:hypothetical protein